MLDRSQNQGYYEIERFMADHEILLAYRDDINDHTVQHILTLTEARLTSVLDNKKFRKRVFQILVECLQNVVNHSYSGPNGKRQSILLLGRGEDSLFIITGNIINEEQVAPLRARIEEVNRIGNDNIRETYSDRLRDSAFSPKGGAGLGLIDMYRRSGNQIDFDFTPVTSDSSFFTMCIKVNTHDQRN